MGGNLSGVLGKDYELVAVSKAKTVCDGVSCGALKSLPSLNCLVCESMSFSRTILWKAAQQQQHLWMFGFLAKEHPLSKHTVLTP